MQKFSKVYNFCREKIDLPEYVNLDFVKEMYEYMEFDVDNPWNDRNSFFKVLSKFLEDEKLRPSEGCSETIEETIKSFAKAMQKSKRSKKQELIEELYFRGLPLLRNALTWVEKDFQKDRRFLFEEIELIHNLFLSLADKDFTDHDIHFLNVQAKRYFEHAKESFLYSENVKTIKQLFLTVPNQMKDKLKWPGPK